MKEPFSQSLPLHAHEIYTQLLGAYEKGWVADNTFAQELQKLLV